MILASTCAIFNLEKYVLTFLMNSNVTSFWILWNLYILLRATVLLVSDKQELSVEKYTNTFTFIILLWNPWNSFITWLKNHNLDFLIISPCNHCCQFSLSLTCHEIHNQAPTWLPVRYPVCVRCIIRSVIYCYLLGLYCGLNMLQVE